MNIKSLLIGSAAAFVAVSGARAADAVVIAEPEPFEYVRVCDTYGVGFYYIPGTETCLRISGLIRYDIDFSEDDEWEVSRGDVVSVLSYLDDIYDDLDEEAADYIYDRYDLDRFDELPFLDENQVLNPGDVGRIISRAGLDEGWAKSATARINIDARSETEWGTFRRFIRLSGTTSGVDGIYGLPDTAGVSVIYAYVELGGLLVGLYDTLYDGEMSVEQDNGGGTPAHQIRYTFSGANGMTFQVSLEEQDYNYDYTPNVLGKIALTQGWGGVSVFAAYDATFEEFGIKGLAKFNVSDAILLEAMATYESGFGDFSVSSANGLKGYEFSLAGAVSFKATDQIKLAVFGQYFGDQHWLGHDNYAVGGQIDYVPVENLVLRAQAKYNGGDSQDFVDGKIRLEAAF